MPKVEFILICSAVCFTVCVIEHYLKRLVAYVTRRYLYKENQHGLYPPTDE
jgi:hypothetical protein